MTKLTFINHASVLIRYQDSYLLTDPWFERPAFGSWLPTFPMFVNPAYLAALRDKLSILISHGHDDHCDDELLPLFDKTTPIVSSDYASPSVSNRVKRLQFTDLRVATELGIDVGPFHIKSFRNEAISLDDATYSIRTPDALIVHCNDNWNALTERVKEKLREELAVNGAHRSVLMSQTNSASGFPLNYRNFDREQKRNLLMSKVRGMVREGTRNAAELGIPNFISYAGYASVFVKDKPEYLEDSLVPTPRFILETFPDEIPANVTVLDILPGDSFDFVSIERSFLGRDYTEDAMKEKSAKYFELYQKIQMCDTYRGDSNEQLDPGAITDFLGKFDTFVRSKVQRSGFSPTILGKTLSIIVDDNRRYTVKFGEGLIDPQESNKEIFVSSTMMLRVLKGDALFENLYTGYNAEFKRQPVNEYNRDIMSYIVMYSYVHMGSVRASKIQA